MDSKNFKKTTVEYYERWLGEQGCLSNDADIQFIYSTERNVAQAGYPSQVDIYCWIQWDKIVVSYGDKAKPQINKLNQKLKLSLSVDEIAVILSKMFNRHVNHTIKYVYAGGNSDATQKAKTLTKDDYSDYRNFFLGCYPNNSDDWLEEYFHKMVQSGHCVGVYEDARIASCTDGPSMPYMTDKVQEIGITTLPGHRGKGYAAIACTKMAENIIANKKVPQWSTPCSNIASQKLAAKVGFVKIADVLTLTM